MMIYQCFFIVYFTTLKCIFNTFLKSKIHNNCQIIDADPQFVEVLKSLGLDKQDYVTDYCTDMENRMMQKTEADAIIRGSITKDGQDFGFGNSKVGLNANNNDGPELD